MRKDSIVVLTNSDDDEKIDFNEALRKRESNIRDRYRRTENEETIHSIYSCWCDVRGPFPVPKACHVCTESDWENFDIDKAGCLKCGRLHACCLGHCRATQTNAHYVCPITGYVTKKMVFQNTFVIDTAHEMSTKISSRRWVSSEHIDCCLKMLINSNTWKQCMHKEIKRIRLKMTNAFHKVAKKWNTCKMCPNIIEMFVEAKALIGYLRIPIANLSNEEYQHIQSVCTQHILQFTCTFQEQLMLLVPMAKIQNLIIGLTYMMRHGVTMLDSLVVLPQYAKLKQILPMETCLKTHFQIPCKIITETENIVKNMLKRFSREELMNIVSKNYNRSMMVT